MDPNATVTEAIEVVEVVEVKETTAPKRSRAKAHTPEQISLAVQKAQTERIAALEQELEYATAKAKMYFKQVQDLEDAATKQTQSMTAAFQSYNNIINSAFNNLVTITHK